MVRLIQKTRYLKSGGGAGYMKYIATWDGVELLPSGYMEYMAQRPRSHGLFSSADGVDLYAAMDEVERHKGKVWTVIWSLRREDAARLGYDNAESWRTLLRAHQVELAQAMKILPSKLRWYAAFHDEGHHPHVHVMIWSTDPKQGYLNTSGIEIIRSKLTNHIFQDELLHLYQEKNISYQKLVSEARKVMSETVRKMNDTLYDDPVIAQKMVTLAQELKLAKGKKVYGYLKKSTKAVVDEIVDQLAKQPEVAEYYETWNQLRDRLESYYKNKPRKRLPLSQQKEFKAIKNAVIQEAENLRLGLLTFENEEIADEEFDEEQVTPKSKWELIKTYREAKYVLDNKDARWDAMQEAVKRLEQLWGDGLTVAAHQLGKCYRDGRGVLPDEKHAEEWFLRAADAGLDFSQYALGKLLQEQGRIDEAVEWYEKASAQGNQYADYRLGKLYLAGTDVPRDVELAVHHLTASAEAGNQYAQYTLGKLYLLGEDVPQDRELAKVYLTASAEQGNRYAQFFLDRLENMGPPSVMLAVTRLLYHASRVFRETPMPSPPRGLQIDRKRLAQLREKKTATGHKPDDHEDGPAQGGITMS